MWIVSWKQGSQGKRSGEAGENVRATQDVRYNCHNWEIEGERGQGIKKMGLGSSCFFAKRIHTGKKKGQIKNKTKRRDKNRKGPVDSRRTHSNLTAIIPTSGQRRGMPRATRKGVLTNAKESRRLWQAG